MTATRVAATKGTTASVHGEGGRPGLRWVLCGVLLLDLYGMIENLYILPAPDVALPWSPAWLVSLDTMVWPVVVLMVLHAVGIAGLARGQRAQLWFGLLTLLTMAVLVETMDAHVGQHRRRFFSTGAVLTGWLVGLAFARLRGADDDRGERLAEAGGAAALAATYIGAGLQKLLAGGLFADHSLQAHILTHHQIDDASVFGSIAQFVALQPTVTLLLASTTVVIQLGSVLYLIGPRARMLWGQLADLLPPRDLGPAPHHLYRGDDLAAGLELPVAADLGQGHGSGRPRAAAGAGRRT